MAARARLTVCTVAGCPTLCTGGRCTEHKRAADRQRGSAAERGYGSKAWRFARRVVLRRDPICVLCKRAFSTLADHWPISRRELVAMGVRDPDAPHRLRGLCGPCHSRETAREQPGGWNRRDGG
jgi:5-methylcytosine-specific restriction enzyme A